MRTLAILAPVMIALATSAHAAAADEGSIIYGKGDSLFRLPMAKGGESTEIVELGFPAETITRLESSRDGKRLLISTGEVHYWTRVGGDKPAVVCRGRATLSGDGRCVLCQSAAGLTLSRLYPKPLSRELEVPGKLATLLGHKTSHVVAVTERGVEAFTITTPRVRTLLARARPTDDLLISPDGKRAVVTLPDSADSSHRSVYQFLLDGKGVKRKLVVDNHAVRWTRDSTWVVAAGPQNTCIARARGGQYRCWNGWRAVAMRPDAKEGLVVRGKPGHLELARVSLEGARPATPRPFLHGAAGDVLWLP